MRPKEWKTNGASGELSKERLIDDDGLFYYSLSFFLWKCGELISYSHLSDLCCRKKVKAIKQGKRWYVNPESVMNYLHAEDQQEFLLWKLQRK